MAKISHEDRPVSAATHSRAPMYSNLLGWSILGLVAAFGFYTCRFGLDLFDSGLYPSMGWRYTQGDLPFRDETFSAHFDILYWLLFYVVPDASQLQIRFLGITIEMAAMVCWFVFLKRFAPPALVALALAACAFVSSGGLWVPGYDVLGTRFLQIGLGLWLIACYRRPDRSNDALAVTSAIFFLIAIMCHPAMTAAIGFPVCAAIWGWIKKSSARWYRPTVIAVVVTLAILTLSVSGLYLLGALDNEAASFQNSGDLVSPAHRFQKVGYGLLLCAQSIAFLTAILFLSTFPNAKRIQRYPLALRGVGLALIAAGGTYYASLLPSAEWIGQSTVTYTRVFNVTEPLWPKWSPTPMDFFGQSWITIIALASLGAVVCRYPFDHSQSQARYRFLVLATALTLIPVSTLHALSSFGGFRSFLFAMPPLFAASIAILYAMAIATFGDKASYRMQWLASLPLVIICVVYANIQMEDRSQRVYGDSNVAGLSTTSSHPLLAGIYTNKERMKLVEETLAYLDPKLEPGDLFIEFGAGPIFYYLTRTRPAMAKTWCIPAYSNARQERLLARMLRDERLPQYCLTSLVHPGAIGYNHDHTWDKIRKGEESPINRYIWDHYDRIEVIGPFEIWERRATPEAPAQ